MIAYSTVHTGPNKKLGGAQVGLMSVLYQLYVLFINYLLVNKFPNYSIAFLCISIYTTFMNELEDEEEVVIQRDAHGNILAGGDSIILIKDLKLKGSNTVIKQGTKAKNIRLTDEEGLIECSIDGMKGIVLKTEFIKKA